MGDLRYAPFYERIRSSPDPVQELRSLDDEALIAALAAASRDDSPYLANMMATELHHRLRLKGAVMHAISEGVLALDMEGRVTFSNRAANDLLGAPPAEGGPIGFILEPRPGCHAPEETLRTGRVLSCDSILRREDGSTFPAAITCAPILDGGEVQGAVLVFHDDTERVESEARASYLAQAGIDFTSTLDYGETLQHIVRLAVPRLATWCAVHAPEDGELRAVATAHKDPSMEARLREHQAAHPVEAEAGTRLAGVMRTGRPQALETITGSLLRESGLGEDDADLLREAGTRSALLVPLVARGHVIGVLSLVRSAADTPFTEKDLPFAEEVSRRAAIALDNALLFAAEHRSRERAEETARRFEVLKDRYESLANAASQAVFVADAEGRAGPDQPQWSALTGQSSEEVAEYGWVDAYHPDDRERALQDWQDAVAQKRPFEGDYRIRLRDGSHRLFAFRVVPVLENDGRIREWVGACTDVTERRRMEDELRRSEERHRQMVEMIPDPIVVHQQGVIVYANPAAIKLMGVRSPDNLLGRSVMDFVHPSSKAQVAERMAEMRRTQRALPLADTRVVREDGRVLDVQVAVMPIVYDEKPSAQLLLRDVTAEHAAAEQLRQFNETLEDRVRDRTAELMALNRELEAFSYTVSHDLRAPLRGVATFANILAEEHGEELSQEARELVERIRRDSNRMGQLIQDLLALSRTGRGEVVRERFDMAELARGVMAALQRQDPSRRVEFVAPAELWVEADPRLMRVVLENLLGNSWKFTGPASHPRIELGTARRDEASAYFVRDNGAGFDMAQADRLFQPFQRLHEGGEFEGTGVGLATVARIIQRHGGKVRAEGERGRGATIWFTLGPA